MSDAEQFVFILLTILLLFYEYRAVFIDIGENLAFGHIVVVSISGYKLIYTYREA